MSGGNFQPNDQSKTYLPHYVRGQTEPECVSRKPTFWERVRPPAVNDRLDRKLTTLRRHHDLKSAV